MEKGRSAPSDAVTTHFQEIKGMCDTLEQEQTTNPSSWVEYTRRPKLAFGRRPKRLWSGGTCSDLVRASTDPGHRIELKVVTYSHERVAGYTRVALDPDASYTGNISFNCVDLPFRTLLTVNLSMTDAFTKSVASDPDRTSFLRQWGVVHQYVLDFQRGTPSPQYYFLSMCRHLLEQPMECPHEIFGEVFCGDFHVPALLSGA